MRNYGNLADNWDLISTDEPQLKLTPNRALLYKFHLKTLQNKKI